VPVDMEREARTLRLVLQQRGLAHLRVVKRGKALTIVSGPESDPDPEVRLTHIPPRSWRLDLRHHSGRWDQTPFVGSLGEMVEMAADIGRLADHDSPGAGNPGDTSDPSHYCAGDPLPDGWVFEEGIVDVDPGTACPAPEDVDDAATEDCCPVYVYQGLACELLRTEPNQVLHAFGTGSSWAPSDSGTSEVRDLCVYRALFTSTGACCGRPLLESGRAVVAAVTAGPRWSAPAAVAVGGLSAADRRRVAAWWSRAAQLEHASIASFARFTLDLMRFGAPPALLVDAHRAGLDEIAHAQLCFALAGASAGEALEASTLPLSSGAGPADRAAFAEAVVREGCVGETLAAIDAAARLHRATDPEIRRVLAIVVEDESRHAALAWRTLAWLLADDADDALRAHVDRVFADARRTLPSDLVSAGDAVPSHGLIDDGERVAALRAGWGRVIDPAWAEVSMGASHGTHATPKLRSGTPMWG
jgi:hypothetical protein